MMLQTSRSLIRGFVLVGSCLRKSSWIVKLGTRSPIEALPPLVTRVGVGNQWYTRPLVCAESWGCRNLPRSVHLLLRMHSLLTTTLWLLLVNKHEGRESSYYMHTSTRLRECSNRTIWWFGKSHAHRVVESTPPPDVPACRSSTIIRYLLACINYWSIKSTL